MHTIRGKILKYALLSSANILKFAKMVKKKDIEPKFKVKKGHRSIHKLIAVIK